MKGASLSGEARQRARQDFEKMREGSKGGSPLVFDQTMEYTIHLKLIQMSCS